MEHILWSFKKGFLIAWFTFCFIIFIMSLILFFTVDEHRYSDHQTRKYKPIQFKTLLNYKEIAFNATWVSDNEILMRDDSGSIILYDVKKSIKSVLAFNSMQHVKNCYKYELSVDKKYLLIGYNFDQTPDGASSANYDIINVKSGKQMTLRDKFNRPRSILVTKWSPVDSSLVVVDQYDIYYIPTVAKPNHAKQITFHGSKDLYHGVPDWVYREEIFHSNSAVWFSTKGSKLAYARFNETLVPSTRLLQYGIPDTKYDQHSKIFSYHYPKVNDSNPTVELFVQNLNITSEPVPVPIKPAKHYLNEMILFEVTWSGDEHLFVMWMNRIQNISHLVHYHIVNNAVDVKEVMDFNQENGWLDFNKSLLVSPEHQVAVIQYIEQNDGDWYRQVCLIKKYGKMIPLTHGKFDVIQLIKWDFHKHEIYFLTNNKHHSKQHMYKVSTIKPYIRKGVTSDSGCDFSRVELSEKNTYYAHTCSGPDLPYVNIMNMTDAVWNQKKNEAWQEITNMYNVEQTTGVRNDAQLKHLYDTLKREARKESSKDKNGEIVKNWESNKKLHKTLEEVVLPRIKFITVPLERNYKAQVKLIIPPTLNNSPGNKYPLLIHTNGGPSLNLVSSEFKIDLNMYMSSNHNFVVAEVDGLGTSRRGASILFANYMNAGTKEIYDQINIAKYLKKKFPFVDEKKTGIWGWGYGGYVAGMVLARDDENVFNCALSIAPITDWIYHDSVFTERFMGKPPVGYNYTNDIYKNASLIELAEGLRHKNYMIIHGLSDTKVHFQHSAMLSKMLQHKHIMFKQQFYPDESHELLNVRNHLYRTFILFMLNSMA